MIGVGREACSARVGPRGVLVWFAYQDGVMLRDKRTVGRRFKTLHAALHADGANKRKRVAT